MGLRSRRWSANIYGGASLLTVAGRGSQQSARGTGRPARGRSLPLVADADRAVACHRPRAIAAFVGTQSLSPVAILILALTAGLYSGLGINTAHELGHKKPALERWLARIVLAVPAYGHFCIEHNRGHHRHVATPTDPASSRMGENIYKFALREIPGAFRRGWQVEKERLARLGKPVWHPENEVLQSYALSAVLQVALVAAFGWIMLPFPRNSQFLRLVAADQRQLHRALRTAAQAESERQLRALSAVAQLERRLYRLESSALPAGAPFRPPCPPDPALSVPAQLPRPADPAQRLFRYVPGRPDTGVWRYRLMDRRLLALPHISGDFSRIDVDPGKRAALEARYGDAVRHGALAA